MEKDKDLIESIDLEENKKARSRNFRDGLEYNIRLKGKNFNKNIYANDSSLSNSLRKLVDRAKDQENQD